MPDDAPSERTTARFGLPPARKEPGEKLRFRPFLWAAAYVLVTTVSFSPTLSFRDAPATPGTIASRDVVAPRDLIVPDPDATARRRAEASAEVLPVYDVDAEAPARFEQQLRESFERARALQARQRPRGSVTSELQE